MGLALVFPGQGAQTIGMGRTLAEAYPEARAVFDEVDDALGEDLSGLIWEGDVEELTLTQNAQPALMATSIAVLRAMEAEGFRVQNARFAAGHSLGEYSALAAVGAITLSDAARLLRLRGEAMQRAVPVGEGAMAAILGLDLSRVEAIAAAASQDLGGRVCQAANDNDPAQVVISGHSDAVDRGMERATEEGAKRAMKLPVSAPFHCPLMAPAAEEMKEALAEVEILPPVIPVVSNVRAAGVGEPSEIRRLLVEQITSVVRWRESVMWMSSEGVDSAWELGAGKALSGMIRRIDRSVSVRSLGSESDIKAALGAGDSANGV